MRFYKEKEHSDKSIAYMFVEQGIIMAIHGKNPPLITTRKKLIEEARLLLQKLLNEGWQKKIVKNGQEIQKLNFLISENK